MSAITISLLLISGATIVFLALLPNWIRWILSKFWVANIVANLFISWLIVLIAGSGMTAGFGNIAGFMAGCAYVLYFWKDYKQMSWKEARQSKVISQDQ